MKRVMIILLCIAANFAAGTLNAQTDNENIQYARAAINVVHNCDDALLYLGRVSADGKTNPDYLLCMALANDCKSNTSQAMLYYNKYLEVRPDNDSVKIRVAQLTDSKEKQSKTANEERVARETYQAASNSKKRKNHKLLKYDYYSVGATYTLATGGDDAPYKNGAGINIGYSGVIFHSRLVLDFSFGSDVLFSHNNDWFVRAFNVAPGEVSGESAGFSFDLLFSPMFVIVNKRNISWTAGPLVGIKYAYINDLIDDAGLYTITSAENILPCYGAKTSFLFGDHGLVFLEYSISPSGTVTTSNNSMPTGINRNALKFGISLRYD